MTDFLDLINKDECCIHYRKLEEYGILKFDNSSDFKKILTKYEFIEN